MPELTWKTRKNQNFHCNALTEIFLKAAKEKKQFLQCFNGLLTLALGICLFLANTQPPTHGYSQKLTGTFTCARWGSTPTFPLIAQKKQMYKASWRLPGCNTGLGKKNKNAIVPLLKTEHAPDRLPRTLLFNIIFHTFCNLFLSGQHILQQNSVTPNKSQPPISKPRLRHCSEFKMKQKQSVFELQIQVKRDSLLQTIWLLGLHSRCAPTGRNTLAFYSNVHSVQIWAESESQRTEPTVLSGSILRGNLSLCWDVCTRENAVCW